MVNFTCQPHLRLSAFKKTSNNSSHKQKLVNLNGEVLVTPSTIILNNNFQRSVNCKLDFVESKSIFEQKPS